MIKKFTSLSIVIAINVLFLVKYVERVTDYYMPITIGISSLYFLLYWYRDKLKIKDEQKKVLFLTSDAPSIFTF